jgi:hypothetical protein
VKSCGIEMKLKFALLILVMTVKSSFGRNIMMNLEENFLRTMLLSGGDDRDGFERSLFE